jgi:hypothetical protein
MGERAFAVVIAGLVLAVPQAAAVAAQGPLTVDYRSVISKADIVYDTPVQRSEEGLPMGNGRMGSLVWTTPSALKFQINRVDVFAENSSTVSFPRPDSDYASGCGYVDINLASAGDDVFARDAFRQHLALYDGLMTAHGNGVSARVLAWNQHDVMAVEIDDRRDRPEAVNIDLRMLRYITQYIPRKNHELARQHAVAVQTAEHTATSRLDIRDGDIILTQEFREGDYYDASAVAVAVLGRQAKARYLNESTVQLSVPAGKGKFTILISSAASFDENQDLAALAIKELHAAAAQGFDGLLADNRRWWHDFWSKGFVSMHSADGQADFVEQNYTYFIYLMGASSRGAYPPRFGGMIWYTNGDMRRWGSQYWWANTNAYYGNLMPANRLELMDPVFSMYSGMYESCALAARQQWGSEGIWIPETVFFDGLERLPDDIAAEMRDLYLVKKPWAERSDKFRWYAETKQRHNSRWNWQKDGVWDHGHYVVPDKGKGPFGHTTHILGATARIAALYWQRYEYTLDRDWLAQRAYPMIKGSAEFYRHFPNFQKGDDGKYHIHHVNNGESQWDSSDTPYEVSCMHTIFPLAVRASELLGVDAELRPVWQEIIDNLVPAPQQTRRSGGGAGGFGAFVYGGAGAIAPLGSEPELKSRFLNFNRLASFIDSQGSGGAQILRNRLRLREGPGAIDAEHIGGLSSGIHSSLLANTPEKPGQQPVIEVFPAWPKDWDAAFKLLARGAFLVTSAQRQGNVEFVQIESQVAGNCQVRNPWGEYVATLYRDGKKAENLGGAVLRFDTRKGEEVLLAPGGTAPEKIRREIRD